MGNFIESLTEINKGYFEFVITFSRPGLSSSFSGKDQVCGTRSVGTEAVLAVAQ